MKPGEDARSKPRPEPSSAATTHSTVSGKKQASNAHPPDGPHRPRDILKCKAEALWRTRRALPVWAHSRSIREALRNHDVLVISGETGSGKSTQVPQILLSESWCKSTPVQSKGLESPGKQETKVGGCIAVTQPRRIAATTLARRVAAEVGTPLGSSSRASQVGYSVRFDHNAGPNTRIKFLTEGMLLQEMLRDPWLRDYSAVVVDEVHERGVNVDLILGFLQILLSEMRRGEDGRGGVPLKVIIMSATAEVERFRNFFGQGFTSSMREKVKAKSQELAGGSKLDGKDFDEEVEWEGFSSSEEGEGSNGPLSAGKDDSQIPICLIEGRQHPVKTIYTPEPVSDWLNTALHTIFQIHYKEALPGDILVFLTGQETVESLEALANEYAQSMDRSLPKLLILPLFAALPQDAQIKVFEPTPSWTRKVVLATNIAETSVTVPGVHFVIDCGKAKVKQFRPNIGLDSLLVKPISKSAAIQRQGRAGREAPGQCYRLYTEKDYLNMQNSNTPEILRCDLSQAILTMKARGVQGVTSFPLLDPPSRRGLEKALLQLFQLGAMTETGEINDIGRQMSRLPLSCPLARSMLAAADVACMAEVIDIISCLSVESIFLNLKSEEKKEEAEAARRTLYRREGDHLTLLAIVQAYASEQSDRKAWADRYFVSHRAMRAVMVCVPGSTAAILSPLSTSCFQRIPIASIFTIWEPGGSEIEITLRKFTLQHASAYTYTYTYTYTCANTTLKGCAQATQISTTRRQIAQATATQLLLGQQQQQRATQHEQ